MLVSLRVIPNMVEHTSVLVQQPPILNTSRSLDGWKSTSKVKFHTYFKVNHHI